MYEFFGRNQCIFISNILIWRPTRHAREISTQATLAPVTMVTDYSTHKVCLQSSRIRRSTDFVA